MEHLKELSLQYERWNNLERICSRIETYLESDFNIAVENCKSLIETVCKTILEEKVITYSKNEKIQTLVGKTISSLELNSTDQLKQLGRAFVTVTQNLSEIRNNISDISHGRSLSQIQKNNLDSVTATFLVKTTSTVCSFLIQYFENSTIFPPKGKPLVFSDFEEFNNYLDDEYGDSIISDYIYPTSEALFLVDETAYNTKYQEYLESLDDRIQD